MKKQISYEDLLFKYKLLSELINNIPDVVYFKDKKGRLLMVNRAHAKGLGLKPQEVIGKTDFDIFSKERAEVMHRDDMYVMKTGKPIIDKIERATRPDGVDNYVSTTKIPRYDNKGRIIGLMGITRDITRRMQFERAREEKAHFQKKLKELEELNKTKSEFISIVSHELKTPLAVIKDSVGLVFDGTLGPINPRQQKLLTMAMENIERIKNMVNELLSISKIESGRFKLHYSLVNLNELIKDSAEFFKRWAESKGIDLRYSLPKAEINLFIDAERINQVLSNLIDNAIKFTEQGGEIKIETEVLENKIRIGVIDTGVGIAKSDLPKLFNRFTQISRIHGSEREGLGLGLSIIKELVEKHGGEVWAESNLGVGSKFYFTLPLFYTVGVLDKRIRSRINQLIEEGISVYLINVLIVNYKEFKKRIKVKPKKLFEEIVSKTFNDFYRIDKRKSPKLFVMDTHLRECSIFFPEALEKRVNKLYLLLRDKIQQYLAKNKLENVFVDLGVSPHFDKIKFHTAQQIITNIAIKKIYIGAEERRFKRIRYEAAIKIFLSKNKTEIYQTVDISQGGVCFSGNRPFDTDTKIKLGLKLPEKKGLFYVRGRVAWVKRIEGLPEGINKYKIGLEFIKLKNKDKKFICKFIKSISA